MFLLFLLYIVFQLLVLSNEFSTISALLIFLSLWIVISKIIDYKIHIEETTHCRKKLNFINNNNEKKIKSIFLQNNVKFLFNTVNINYFYSAIFLIVFFVYCILIKLFYLTSGKFNNNSLLNFLNYEFFNIIYFFIFNSLSKKYLTKIIPFFFRKKNSLLTTEKFFNYKKSNYTLFLNKKNEDFCIKEKIKKHNSKIINPSTLSINSIKELLIFILFSSILLLLYKYFNFYVLKLIYPINSEFNQRLYIFYLRLSLLTLSFFYFVFPFFVSFFIKDFLIYNYLKKFLSGFIFFYFYFIIHWNFLILKEAFHNFHFVFSKGG